MEAASNSKKKTICFVAGKSGGHIIPCLTRAQQLLKRYPMFTTLFFTTDGDLDYSIIKDKKEVAEHVALRLGNFPYKKLFKYPVFIWQFIRAFFVALYYLHKKKPQQVVSTGGYIAIPVCFAAYLLKIPIELQLLDAVPGKAIRFLSPFAQVISICFEESKKYLPAHKCMQVSYPVRFEKHDKTVSKKDARKQLHLDPDKFTIFVLGGSQGSIFLNTIIKDLLIAHKQWHKKIQIIHQTGAQDTTDWQTFYKDNSIEHFVFSYYHQLNTCYRATDIIICRAGAGTLFELNYFELPALIIPLKTQTTAHQMDNASAFNRQFPDRCSVIEQDDSQIRHKIASIISKKLMHH